MRVTVLFGTRPEAIKLAPVIAELRRYPREVTPLVISTGQHREMLDQVLSTFELRPDADLDLLAAWRNRVPALDEITSRALERISRALETHPTDLLIVQGDTSTAFAGALAAFYRKIPVAHVEAGLRTGTLYDPFPEEANRALIARVASLHFAPTDLARQNLLDEGIDPATIHVTGNTSIDALHTIVARTASRPPVHPNGAGAIGATRTILTTLHRRENWGEPMAAACRALRRILDETENVSVRFPMHRNPIVRETVRSVLGEHPRAQLEEPLEYFSFVHAMSDAHLIVTDSGGVQEEGPALGKPVLVLRETTERPEGVEAGTAKLVGTSEVGAYQEIRRLLDDPGAYAAMAHAANPYGDGHASERIVRALLDYRNAARRP